MQNATNVKSQMTSNVCRISAEYSHVAEANIRLNSSAELWPISNVKFMEDINVLGTLFHSVE